MNHDHKIYRYEFIGLDGSIVHSEESSFAQTPHELHLSAQIGLSNVNARVIATRYVVRDSQTAEIIVSSDDWINET
ncbi:MAG: hypothetical protein NW206_19410 [Hyphomonadaceae bacterium]|nr:hypothetical protein [Hyphomonadaceae bacterium]